MEIPNSDFGRWVKLGLLTKKEGQGGTLTIVPPANVLRMLFQVDSYQELCNGLVTLPSLKITVTNSDILLVSVTDNCNESLTVTFKKWHVHQIDNSRERVAKWRDK